MPGSPHAVSPLGHRRKASNQFQELVEETSNLPIYTGTTNLGEDANGQGFSKKRAFHAHRKSFEVPKQMAQAIRSSVGASVPGMSSRPAAVQPQQQRQGEKRSPIPGAKVSPISNVAFTSPVPKPPAPPTGHAPLAGNADIGREPLEVIGEQRQQEEAATSAQPETPPPSPPRSLDAPRPPALTDGYGQRQHAGSSLRAGAPSDPEVDSPSGYLSTISVATPSHLLVGGSNTNRVRKRRDPSDQGSVEIGKSRLRQVSAAGDPAPGEDPSGGQQVKSGQGSIATSADTGAPPRIVARYSRAELVSACLICLRDWLGVGPGTCLPCSWPRPSP